MTRTPLITMPDRSLLEQLDRREGRALFTASLNIKVVTPLFGGGVVAGEVDVSRPINAKTIRGHMRFWWRACRAGEFSDVMSLFKAEEAIWGSTDIPSAVKVAISNIDTGSEVKWYAIQYDSKKMKYVGQPTEDGRSFPAYALFPFQGEIKNEGKDRAKSPDNCWKDVSFTLHVRFPSELRNDVLAALRAWLLFGGVGARTRRGCGSLCCTNWKEYFGELIINRATTDQLLPSSFISRLSPGVAPSCPVLDHAVLFIGNESKSGIQAWSAAVNLMRDFRQRKGYARNVEETANRPGKSRWPEADTIRQLAKCVSCKHKPMNPPLNYYPRADLGLPILFQFIGCAGCPKTHTIGINDNATGRMASPIILKPLAISETDFRPMVLLLNTPHVWESGQKVVLKSIHGHKDLQQREIDDPAINANVSPMSGKDVRQAFLTFARNEIGAGKYQEVIL